MSKIKKWCSYCQKDDHNDSECWCTRAVEPRNYSVQFSMDALKSLKTGKHLLHKLKSVK